MRTYDIALGLFARIHQGLAPIRGASITCMLAPAYYANCHCFREIRVRFLEDAVMIYGYFMVY